MLLFASDVCLEACPARAYGSIGRTPPTSLFRFRVSLPVPTCYLMFPLIATLTALYVNRIVNWPSDERPCYRVLWFAVGRIRFTLALPLACDVLERLAASVGLG